MKSHKTTTTSKKTLNLKQKILRALIFRVAPIGLAAGVLAFGTLFLLVRIGAFGPLPAKGELERIQHSIASELISSDGQLIGRYYYQNRTNASIDDIPQHLIDALVATEDVRFYQHKGIDFRSTLRVIFKTILLFDHRSGGGSTLSQQLAKNLFNRGDHGIMTMPVVKLREIIIARRLEDIYTKNEILVLYLNTVSFGENTYGIETASLVYFNKKPRDLTIEESAVLIGLLKANTYYNPRLHHDAALKRRNRVIHQMAKYKKISSEQGDSLQNLPLEVNYHPLNHTEGLAPYFREFIRQEANKVLKDCIRDDGLPYNLYTDGLVIYTTLNARMQQYAEDAMHQHMFRLQKTFDEHWKNSEPWKKNTDLAGADIRRSKAYQSFKARGYDHSTILDSMQIIGPRKVYAYSGEHEVEISALDSVLHHFRYLQNGFLVMNHHNGNILAWVGGINYKYFKYDHVLAKRQVGSTFKPIVFATALEKGYSPCDFIPNDSIVYTEYDNWCPSNSHGGYGGEYSLKGALSESINTVSVNLLMETGFDDVIRNAYAMGIESNLPRVPSLALGTAEISLLEMVTAYTSFANKGIPMSSRIISHIEDASGKIIYINKPAHTKRQAIRKETAETVLAMMRCVADSGTASGLRTIYGLKADMAGKTGTTENHADGWFIGITPDLVAGSWVGGDNPIVRFRSLYYGQGAYSALPVYAYFMQKLYSDPIYKAMQNQRFSNDSIYQELLACNDFREKAPPKVEEILDKGSQTIENLIKRIFKRRKKEQSHPEPNNSL